MFQTMCALRIYLRRSDMAEAKGFWQRLFRRPRAAHLVNEALRAGITHASLSYANMGFARGAKVIGSDISELPGDSLPVCVELVGPRPLLEQFAHDRSTELADATLVMLEGVHVRTTIQEELNDGAHVEYVRVGKDAVDVAIPELGADGGMVTTES